MRRAIQALITIAFGAILTVIVTACPGPPVNPTPDGDAQPPPPTPGGPSCASWCAHAATMGCPAGQPTPGGASCEDVCANTLTGPAAFNVACRTAAPSCEVADACESGVLAGATRASSSQCDGGPPSDAGVDASARDAGSRDAGPPPFSNSACGQWCLHAWSLGCASARPTPGGASCEAVCTNVMGGPKKWNLTCRKAARTCAAADACER